MAFLQTTAASISSGGTINGDLTIAGDLTVSGGGGFAFTEVISASDSGASHTQYTNSSTGSGAGSGTLFGIGADEEAQIWNYRASHMVFATADTERMRILSGGSVGIGEVPSVANTVLTTQGQNVRFNAEGGETRFIFNASNAGGDAVLKMHNNAQTLNVNIDAGSGKLYYTGGKLGIGTASPSGTASKSVLDIENTTTNSATQGGNLRLGANDGTVMVATDRLGVIEFAGAEDTSSTMTVGARIEAVADATWSASENGADMVFYTTDGNAAQLEHLRIKSGSAVNLVVMGSSTATQVDFAGSDGAKDGSIYAESGNVGFADQDNNWGVRVQNDVQTSLYVNNSIKLLVDANSRISLSNNDSGANNTIFGKTAGDTDGAGDFNVYIGELAGGAGTQTDASDANVGVGYKSLEALTTGNANIALGAYSAYVMNTGVSNVAIGSWDATDGGALQAATAGSYNIAIGTGALGVANENDNDGTVAIGHLACRVQYGTGGAQFANATTAVGYKALTALTTGAGNTAIGYTTLSALTTGAKNVALGYDALGDVAIEETGNIAIGHSAMSLMDEGSASNIDYNIALGFEALKGHDKGTSAGVITDNIAIGYRALGHADFANSTNPQIGTIGIGTSALAALTSGAGNTAVGYTAGAALIGGGLNTILGYQALDLATTVNKTIAIGHSAMGAVPADQAVEHAIAIGVNAMLGGASTTDGINGNIAIGGEAGKLLTTGGNNVLIGYAAGDELLTGENNTILGRHTLGNGDGDEDDNTLIGYSAGDVIDAGNQITCLGSGTDPSTAAGANQTVIGYGTTGVANNSVTLGNADVTSVYMASDSGAAIHCAKVYTSAGIVFPATQNASGDANTLDDYEEGTWTPAVTDGSNIMTAHGGIGGVYTKIGRVVHISAIILTTGLNGASGDIKVTGLPFTIRNDTDSYGGLAVGNAEGLNISSGENVHCKLTPNTTEFVWRNSDNAGGMTTLQASEWSDNGEVTISGMYTVE